MKFPWTLAALAMLGGSSAAQTPFVPQHQVGNISSTIVSFPQTFPFTTLTPLSPSNPDGYDLLNPGYWPVNVGVGELDGIEGLDLLYTVGERTLLAVGFTRNAAGVPISAYPIWVVHNPNGMSHHALWDTQRSVIWDIDGDGRDEVAFAAYGNSGGPYDIELQVIEDYATATLTPVPGHPTVMTPNIAASWSFNANAPGWVGRILGQEAVICTIGNMVPNSPLPELPEIVVSSSEGGETKVLYYDAAAGLLSLVGEVPWLGHATTHDQRTADLDGDGFDELLMNGAISFTGSFSTWQFCKYWGSNPPSWACGTSSWDHGDAIAPFGDLNGDGVLDLVIVDDGYTKIASGAFSGTPVNLNGMNAAIMPETSLLYENLLAPTIHGQTVSIGHFIDGPDAFGVTGMQAVFCPKGAPYYNGTGIWGTYMANMQLDTLADSVGGASGSPTVGNGPTGWEPRNFDWDGDTTTDELFNSAPNGLMSVFRLAPATGTFPYAWEKVAEISHWGLGGPTYQGSSMLANMPLDFFGDEREEMLLLGPTQVVFVSNAAAYPAAGSRRSPWETEDYRRRFSSAPTRFVDYRAMPTLERVEIRPAVLALEPGTTSDPLSAIAIYSDGSERDVTSLAQFSSAMSGAEMSGNRVRSTTNREGVMAIQASFAGMSSDQPCLARINFSPAPYIPHAGWMDTRLVANVASDLVMEAAVADVQSDVLLLGLVQNGVVLSTDFVDNGTGADRVAGDNIWTLLLPNFIAPTSGDSYFEVIAMDATLQFSNLWPNVNVGGGTALAVPGYPQMPFASENQGATGPGPRISSCGVLDSYFGSTGGGLVVLGARITDPDVQVIDAYMAGGSPLAGMNDSGTGADQLAGDGLWTVRLTFPTGTLAPGNHLFDLVAGSTATPSPVSDAHPRLRVHIF